MKRNANVAVLVVLAAVLASIVYADQIPCSVVADDSTLTVDLAIYQAYNAEAVDVMNCHWTGADVTFKFSLRAKLRLSHVTVVGGAYRFAPDGSGTFPHSSSIEIDSSSSSGAVSHAFSFEAAQIGNLTVTVRSSNLLGTESVLSLATNRVENVSINIENSVLNVTNTVSSAMVAVVFPVESSTFIQVDGFSISAAGSTLIARGCWQAGCMGVTTESPNLKLMGIAARQVVLRVESCNVTVSSAARTAVGAGFLSSFPGATLPNTQSSVSLTGATFIAKESSISVTSSRSCAGLGVASTAGCANTSISGVVFEVENSVVAAETESSVAASAGVASSGYWLKLSHFSVFDLAITGIGSSVSSIAGIDVAAAMGIAHSGEVAFLAENINFHASQGCKVSSRSNTFGASSIGVALDNRDRYFRASLKNIFVVGEDVEVSSFVGKRAAASLGLAFAVMAMSSSTIPRSFLVVNISQCEIRSVRSKLASSSGHVCSASAGVCGVASALTLLGLDGVVLIAEQQSYVYSTSQYGAASSAIVSMGIFADTAPIVASNLTILGNSSTVATDTQYESSVCLGVSSSSSHNSFAVLSLIDVNLTAYNCTAVAFGRNSAVALGISTYAPRFTVSLYRLAIRSISSNLSATVGNSGTSGGLAFFAGSESSLDIMDLLISGSETNASCNAKDDVCSSIGVATMAVSAYTQHTMQFSVYRSKVVASVCNAVANGGNSVSSLGFSHYGGKLNVSIVDVGIFSFRCVARSSTTERSSSSVGLSMWTYDRSFALSVRDVLFYGEDSVADSSSNDGSAASLGLCASTYATASSTMPSCTLASFLSNISLLSVKCSVSSFTKSYPSASLGIAQYSTAVATTKATDLFFHAVDSNILNEGKSAASAGGCVFFGVYRRSSLVVANSLLSSDKSSYVIIISGDSAALLGISVHGMQSDTTAEIDVSNTLLIASECNASVFVGGNGAAVLGLSTYTAGVQVALRNVSIHPLVSNLSTKHSRKGTQNAVVAGLAFSGHLSSLASSIVVEDLYIIGLQSNCHSEVSTDSTVLGVSIMAPLQALNLSITDSELLCVQCNTTALASVRMSCAFGICSFSGASLSVVRGIAITAMNSTIVSSAQRVAASGGIAIFLQDSKLELEVDEIKLRAYDSHLSASADTDASTLGIAHSSYHTHTMALPVSRVESRISNIVICAVRGILSSKGNFQCTTSGGICVGASANAAVAIRDIILHCSDSHVSSEGVRTSTSFGVAASVLYGPVSVSVERSVLCSNGSTVYSYVAYDFSSALGLTINGKHLSRLVLADAVFIATHSIVTAEAKRTGATAIGLNCWGYKFNMTTVNVTLCTASSNVTSLAKCAAASVAIALCGIELESYLEARDLLAWATHSFVVARATHSGAAAVGKALYSFRPAQQPAIISLGNITFAAFDCTVEAEAQAYAAASVGIGYTGMTVHLKVEDVILHAASSTVLASAVSVSSAASVGLSVACFDNLLELEIVNITAFCEDSIVSASVMTWGAAAVGIEFHSSARSTGALSRSSVSANVAGVLLYAVNSQIGANAVQSCAPALGIASGSSCTVSASIREVTFFSENSTLSSSTNNNIASCMGISVHSSQQVALEVADVVSCAFRSVLSIKNSDESIAVLGVVANSDNANLSVVRFTGYADSCDIEAAASRLAAASLAVAVYAVRNTYVFADSITMSAMASYISCSSGLDTSASLGISVFSYTSFVIVSLRNTTLYCEHCNIWTEAKSRAAAAVGIVAMAFQGYLITDVREVFLCCKSCTVSTRVNDVTAVLGIIFNSDGVSVSNVTRVAIYGETVTALSHANYDAALAFGILSMSVYNDCVVNTSSISVFAAGSAVTAKAMRTLGVAFGIFSWSQSPKKSSLAIADGLAIYVSDSQITVGVNLGGALAILSGSINASGIEFVACNSSFGASKKSIGSRQWSVVGGSFSATGLNAHWVLLNVDFEGTICLTFAPSSGGGNSILGSTSFRCVETLGWNSGSSGHYYARNVSIDGALCGYDCLRSTLPGIEYYDSTERIFDGPCDLHFAHPSAAVADPLPAPEVPKPHFSVPPIPPPCSLCFVTDAPAAVASQTPTVTSTFSPTAAASISLVRNRTRTAEEGSESLTQALAQIPPTQTSTTPLTTLSKSLSSPPTLPATTVSANHTLPADTLTGAPNVTNTSARNPNPNAAVLSILLPSGTAEVVATASPISTAASGLATPTAATQYSRVAAVLRAALCILSEDEDTPSRVEHPLQFSLGSGSLPRFCGACVSDMMLLVAFHVAQLIFWRAVGQSRVSESARNIGKFVGIVATLLTAYFLPNMVGAASILLFNEKQSATELFVAVLAMCMWCALLGWPLWLTLHLSAHVSWKTEPHRGRIEVKYENLPFSGLFIELFAKYFDDGRDPGTLWCRLLFFEELFSASVSAFLSGIRPSAGGCIYVLVSILAVSVAHLMYQAIVRPFNRRLATAFAVASALIVVVICVIGIFVIYDETKQELLGYPLLLQNSIFFLQAVAEGVWAYVTASKRSVAQRQAEATRALLGDRDDDDEADAELETVIKMKSNPLQDVTKNI